MPPKYKSKKKRARSASLPLEEYDMAEKIDPRKDRAKREERRRNDEELLGTIVVKDDKEIEKWNARFGTSSKSLDKETLSSNINPPAKQVSKVTKTRLIMNRERRRAILEAEAEAKAAATALANLNSPSNNITMEHDGDDDGNMDNSKSIWDLPSDGEINRKKISKTTYKKHPGRPKKQQPMMVKDYSDEENDNTGKQHMVTDDEEEEDEAVEVNVAKAVTITRAVAVEKVTGRRRSQRNRGKNEIIKQEEEVVEDVFGAEQDTELDSSVETNPNLGCGRRFAVEIEQPARRRFTRLGKNVTYYEGDNDVDHQPDDNENSITTRLRSTKSPIIPPSRPSSHRGVFGRRPTSSHTPSKRAALSPPHTSSTKCGGRLRGRVRPSEDSQDTEQEPTTPTPRTGAGGGRGSRVSRGRASMRGRNTGTPRIKAEPSDTDNEPDTKTSTPTMKGRRGRVGIMPSLFGQRGTRSPRGRNNRDDYEQGVIKNEPSDNDEPEHESRELGNTRFASRGANKSARGRGGRGWSTSGWSVVPETPRTRSIKKETESDNEEDDRDDSTDDNENEGRSNNIKRKIEQNDEEDEEEDGMDLDDDYNFNMPDAVDNEDDHNALEQEQEPGQEDEGNGMQRDHNINETNTPAAPFTPARMMKTVGNLLGLKYFSV